MTRLDRIDIPVIDRQPQIPVPGHARRAIRNEKSAVLEINAPGRYGKVPQDFTSVRWYTRIAGGMQRDLYKRRLYKGSVEVH